MHTNLQVQIYNTDR